MICLQCFDAVGWASGGASGLWKTKWWGAGMVICLQRGADLHIVQLMPLSLTISCCSSIQIGFTFLLSAYPCSPGQRAVKCAFLLQMGYRCLPMYAQYAIMGIFPFSYSPYGQVNRWLIFSMFTYYAELGWYQFNINIKTSLNSNSTRNKQHATVRYVQSEILDQWISGFLPSDLKAKLCEITGTRFYRPDTSASKSLSKIHTRILFHNVHMICHSTKRSMQGKSFNDLNLSCSSKWLSDKGQSNAHHLIDWVEVLHPTRHKTGHFRDILPSHSLALVLKN